MRRTPSTRFAASLLLLGLAACGGGTTGPVDDEVIVSIARTEVVMGVGGSDSIAAIVLGPGGTAVSRTISWRSTSPTVATVSSTGRVDGVAPGVTSVIASVGTVADTVSVVVYGPLAQLIVTIDKAVIKSSDTTRVRARGVDAGGRPVPIDPEWESGDTTVALVTPGGLVFGLAFNRNTILTAKVNGITGFTFVSVIQSVTKSIRILPVADTIGLGVAITMQAEVLDEFDVVVTDRPVTWTSSNPDVVSVHPTTGAIFAISPGSATITATVEGFTATESFVVLAIPQNVYLLDVTNSLFAAVRLFVNDSLVAELPEQSTASFQFEKTPSTTVRWQLVRPWGETAGEPLTETFPTVTAPSGVVRFEIDNVVNGKSYFTPLIRSLVAQKFLIDLTDRDLAGPCTCAVSSEDERRFGYWPMRAGISLLLIRTSNPSVQLTVPVNLAEVEARTGAWRYTVLTAP